MALRERRIEDFLAPEATPEPWLVYRGGKPALTSFMAFVLLLAPPALVWVALSWDSLGDSTWLVWLAIAVPAFICAFLLPRGRRHRVALGLAVLDGMLVVFAIGMILLYLLAEAQCGDRYECPF